LGAELVQIRLVFGPGGILRSAEASGHAGNLKAGSNPACAAITVLLRTAYETFAAYPGVKVSGEAPDPGFLAFNVITFPPDTVEWIKGVGDFLLVGLSGVQREYPDLINVTIER
jgi:uncharacterized protein YsxB (DUF464 family)